MTQADCLRYLQENGNSTARDIIDATGDNKSAVYQKLKALSKHGFVDKINYKHPNIYTLTEKGQNYDVKKLEGMVV